MSAAAVAHCGAATTRWSRSSRWFAAVVRNGWRCAAQELNLRALSCVNVSSTSAQSSHQQKILVINAGSSSLKYKVFSIRTDDSLVAEMEGDVVKIGDPSQSAVHSHRDLTAVDDASGRSSNELKVVGHDDAIRAALRAIKPKRSSHADYEVPTTQFRAVGHRVVHGGERFSESVVVDDVAEAAIEKLCDLAPLHNSNNLSGIRAARHALGARVPQVAVFDTAFHATLPRKSYLYALPRELYDQLKVRRYGMHGTSYRYVAQELHRLGFGRQPSRGVNAIVLHLGAGSSMCCIRDGKSLDTTMGMTPLEGLVMSTRSGDIDPGVLTFLAQHKGLDFESIDTMLNKKSGLHGLCGSGDLRVVLERADKGDQNAVDAYELLVHRVRKYLGAFLVELEGQLDAVVFTAGMGENSARLRSDVLAGLDSKFQIALDLDKNALASKEIEKQGWSEVQTTGFETKIVVMRTDEELQIARETLRVTAPARK